MYPCRLVNSLSDSFLSTSGLSKRINIESGLVALFGVTSFFRIGFFDHVNNSDQANSILDVIFNELINTRDVSPRD